MSKYSNTTNQGLLDKQTRLRKLAANEEGAARQHLGRAKDYYNQIQLIKRALYARGWKEEK